MLRMNLSIWKSHSEYVRGKFLGCIWNCPYEKFPYEFVRQKQAKHIKMRLNLSHLEIWNCPYEFLPLLLAKYPTLAGMSLLNQVSARKTSFRISVPCDRLMALGKEVKKNFSLQQSGFESQAFTEILLACKRPGKKIQQETAKIKTTSSHTWRASTFRLRARNPPRSRTRNSRWGVDPPRHDPTAHACQWSVLALLLWPIWCRPSSDKNHRSGH